MGELYADTYTLSADRRREMNLTVISFLKWHYIILIYGKHRI